MKADVRPPPRLMEPAKPCNRGAAAPAPLIWSPTRGCNEVMHPSEDVGLPCLSHLDAAAGLVGGGGASAWRSRCSPAWRAEWPWGSSPPAVGRLPCRAASPPTRGRARADGQLLPAVLDPAGTTMPRSATRTTPRRSAARSPRSRRRRPHGHLPRGVVSRSIAPATASSSSRRAGRRRDQPAGRYQMVEGRGSPGMDRRRCWSTTTVLTDIEVGDRLELTFWGEGELGSFEATFHGRPTTCV